MNNNDLLRFWVANSIAGSMANSLQEQRMEMAEQLANITTEEELSVEVESFMSDDNAEGAYEYLNSRFNMEIIDAAQNQKDYVYSLETLLEMRREKYLPFYERIGRKMPEYLAYITADDLCNLLGVKNMHIPDKTDNKVSKVGVILLVTVIAFVLLAIIAV